MKKVSNAKKNPNAKKEVKAKDSAELRKPSKLKPLKEKEKKNWKNSLNEEEDFDVLPEESDLKFDDSFNDDSEEEDFYDDNY